MNYFCSSVDPFLLTGSRDVDRGALMHYGQRAAIIYVPWCSAPCTGRWKSPSHPCPTPTERVHTCPCTPAHAHSKHTHTDTYQARPHTHTRLSVPRHTGDALSLFSPRSEPALLRGKRGKAISPGPLILLRRRLHIAVITADLKVAQPRPAPKLK